MPTFPLYLPFLNSLRHPGLILEMGNLFTIHISVILSKVNRRPPFPGTVPDFGGLSPEKYKETNFVPDFCS